MGEHHTAFEKVKDLNHKRQCLYVQCIDFNPVFDIQTETIMYQSKVDCTIMNLCSYV